MLSRGPDSDVIDRFAGGAEAAAAAGGDVIGGGHVVRGGDTATARLTSNAFEQVDYCDDDDDDDA